MEVSPRWHVAKFTLGHELAAARLTDHTNEGGLASFCPVEQRSWVVRGEERVTLAPVLSGYVFVQMMPGDPYRWHEVAARSGFYGFIGEDMPAPVKPGVVEDLLMRSTEDWILQHAVKPQQHQLFSRGTIVRVAFGCLENCSGVVEWTRYRSDETGLPPRLVAQVRTTGFFGLEMRAEIPVEWLDRVGKQEAQKVRTLLDLPVLRPAVIA